MRYLTEAKTIQHKLFREQPGRLIRAVSLVPQIPYFANLFLGGWQLAEIFRANSGLPISGLGDKLDCRKLHDTRRQHPNLPWENHKLQLRWEVFNVANTQQMGNVVGYEVELDPQNATQAFLNFANFTSIQGTPRSIRFVLRYSF